MMSMYELPIPSETLDEEEVSKISGCQRKTDQVEWLTKNGWVFFQNRAGMPIIGRLYARLKLSGINPAALASNNAGSSWGMGMSKVR